MPQINWTPGARLDLIDIDQYISHDNPSAAAKVIVRIRNRVRRLAGMPGLGRPGRIDGTRELVVPETPYIVAYRILGNVVDVLAVIHGAREWPETF